MVEEGAGVCWSGVLLGCVNDSLDVAVGEGEAGGLSSAGGGLGEGAGFEFGDEDAEGGGEGEGLGDGEGDPFCMGIVTFQCNELATNGVFGKKCNYKNKQC